MGDFNCPNQIPTLLKLMKFNPTLIWISLNMKKTVQIKKNENKQLKKII